MPLRGDAVRLIASTSAGPKGGDRAPPVPRSWLPAARVRAASRPGGPSAAGSPALRRQWAGWPGSPHRRRERPRASPRASPPSPPARATPAPGPRPAADATPRRACVVGTSARLGPGLPHPCPPSSLLSCSSPLSADTVRIRGVSFNRGAGEYRFRERLNDNPILRDLINPGRSRRDEPKSDMALIADEKKGLVLLSLCPTKSGFWCSRCRKRRPYVSWNWLGNHQVENKAQTWMPI